jgi:HCO3- transporter integral membrane domain
MKELRSSPGTLVFLDKNVEHFTELQPILAQRLPNLIDLPPSDLERVLEALSNELDAGPQDLDRSVAVHHAKVDVPGLSLQIFIRFSKDLKVKGRHGAPIRFAWFLLSDQDTHPHLDVVAEFVQLMADPQLSKVAHAASTGDDIWDAYVDLLPQRLTMAKETPGLKPTGRLFGGLKEDTLRRLPHYVSDLHDGLRLRTVASTVFLFFAVLAPSIAFGGLLSITTRGQIGVVETLIGTAIGGCIYALLSGQPLTILGSTGPIIIFLGILYELCEKLAIPYLPTLSCVGLWTSFFLVVLVAIDGCSWMRFFTRFTDDIFAGLISLIYIAEAISKMTSVFSVGGTSHDTALLSLILSIGTFWIATNLSRFRRSKYLRRATREFLADFGPAIAILAMTAVALWMHQIEVQTLNAPSEITTTSGRDWFVSPLAAPHWVLWASAVPAVLATILVFLDQNITVRLVNNPGNRLVKGQSYHLDLLIVALMLGVFSLLGLPWLVAATVRSLNHVRSLANVDRDSGLITSVIETRLSGLSIHVLLGISLLFLPYLKLIPMPVLFGLFLYMGVAALSGNSFFERLSLWAMDPIHYPPTHYLRAVPVGSVHRFTAVQVACLAALWLVKTSVLAILFPLLIAGLVPVRLLLNRFLKAEHIALLDGDEEPQESLPEAFPG